MKSEWKVRKTTNGLTELFQVYRLRDEDEEDTVTNIEPGQIFDNEDDAFYNANRLNEQEDSDKARIVSEHEAIQAARNIRKFCMQHKGCEGCPFQRVGCGFRAVPAGWEFGGD